MNVIFGGEHHGKGYDQRMTTDSAQAGDDPNRRVSENVSTLMFRMGMKQNELAREAGLSANTLGRKLKGVGDWSVREVSTIAEATWVKPVELITDVPSYEDWDSRREGDASQSEG